jgi:tyrosyl-tRNA synthetase
MKRLTFMDMEEISRVEREMGEAGYVPNTAQRRLAEEVTRFVHGAKGLEQALKATEGLKPGSDTVLDAETLESLADDIPCAEVTRDELVGRPVIDVMAATGLQKSKGEAKRMVKGGGARVNNVKVTDEEKLVEEEDVIEGRVMLLAAGKKNKLLVRVVG